MKKNLEIIEIEPKLTKDEKKYWRIKTSEGWMPCFNAVCIEAIKKLEGNIACLELKENNYTNKNGEEIKGHRIDKCYGEAQDKEETDWREDEKPEVVKPGAIPQGTIKVTNGNNHATMYTSYAKDIFCEIYDGTKVTEEIVDYDLLMKAAIELVKQAREAFE